MSNLKTALFRYLSAFGALALFLALPRSAQALELEYYTYGGFSDVVSAFTKAALVFSDSGYMVLATTIFIGALAWGLFKAGINKLYAAVPGEGGLPPSYDGVWSALLNAFVATVLFFGLIVPKGTLHIYDPTENQYQAVGGIPLIGVISAGASSMIERALVEIVETSSSPLAFSKQAGIKGIQVMNALVNRGGESINATFEKSLDNYIQDCVYFELKRPGTTLKIKELSETTPSIMETSFPKAVNPSISTVVYAPDGDAAGITTSCTDAWTDGAYGLSPRYTAAIANPATGEYKDLMTRVCKDAGYSTYDPNPAVATAALNACVTNTSSLISSMSPTWSLGKFIGETRAAYRFMIVEASDSPALVLQQNKMTAMTSQLAEFLQGLATKRGVIVAMAAVALPFVCLLLFTQGYKMLLATILAMFMLPSIWGILMAAVSDFYLSNMVAGWTQILDDTASGGKGVMALGTLGSDMLLGASYWGLYLATTFGIAMTLASKLSSSAAAVGGMARAQGNMMEGNTEMGRLGMGASERQKVATSEGAGLTGHRMADNMANAMTGLRGEDRLDFGMQTGGGQADWQKAGLDAGLIRDAAAGSGKQNLVQGVSANQTIAAVGMDNMVDAKTFDATANALTQLDQKATYGTADNKAKWNMADEKARLAAFGNHENYQAFRTLASELDYRAQSGLIQAAEKLGIDPRDQAQMGAYVNKLREGGQLQALQEGKITAEDLIREGKVGAQVNAGDAIGKERGADTAGKTLKANTSDNTFASTAQANASFLARQTLADKVFGNHDDKTMQRISNAEAGQMSTVLNKEMAAHLNKQAEKMGSKANFKDGQRVSFAMGEDGSIKFADGQGGMFSMDKNGWTKAKYANSIDDASKLKTSKTTVESGYSYNNYAQDLQHIGFGATYTGQEAMLQSMMDSGTTNKMYDAANLGQLAVTNYKAFEEKVSALATVQSKALSPYLQRTGTSTDQFMMGLTASIATGTPGMAKAVSPIQAEIKATAGGNYSTQDARQQDIIAKSNQMLKLEAARSALAEGKAKHLTPQQTAALVNQRMATVDASFNRGAVMDAPEKYGVQRPGYMMNKAASGAAQGMAEEDHKVRTTGTPINPVQLNTSADASKSAFKTSTHNSVDQLKKNLGLGPGGR